jgi:hypothetical protein
LLLILANPVHAATVFIDNFNTSQGPVVDVAGGGFSVATNSTPPAGELWTQRTLSVGASGTGIFAGDPSAVIGGGVFGINNDSLETSNVSINWALPAIPSLAGITNASLVLSILFNNSAAGTPTFAAPVTGLIAPDPYALPITFNGSRPFSIPLNVYEISEFAAGTNFHLSFIGGNGFDLVLTSVAIVSSVPEPSEWMLLMAGLGAVGALARRAKSAAKSVKAV